MSAILDTDFIGQRVSHYQIVGFIGSGGMGKVYLARDEQLSRHVAIKVLFGDRNDRSTGNLLTEARLLSRFTHPHVAAIYDFLSDDHQDYMVMEYVPGPTLRDVVASGPLHTEDVVRLGVQLARGVAAAHAARVLHRDLKPQNIKLTPAGRLKILDFGVASTLVAKPLATISGPPSSTHPGGTIPYMSPEQLRGDALDERSDIFSIGALLYEMAAGRPAFPQRHFAHLIEAILYQNPPPLTTVNPFVPAALERVVNTALQKEPQRRQRRAAMLVAELSALGARQTLARAGGRSGERRVLQLHRVIGEAPADGTRCAAP